MKIETLKDKNNTSYIGFILCFRYCLILCTFSFAIVFTSACNVANDRKAVQDAKKSFAKSSAEVTKYDVVYPHTAEFIKTKNHGLAYHQNSQNCKSCHGEELLGKDVKIGSEIKKALSCGTANCHPGFPHTEKFKKCMPGQSCEHGKSYNSVKMLVGKPSNCFACHTKPWETTPSGRPSTMVCNKCHSNFPHKDEFKKIEKVKENNAKDSKAYLNRSSLIHGKAYFESITKNDGNNQCMGCHKFGPYAMSQLNSIASSSASETEMFCNKCHDYPHSKSWVGGQANDKSSGHGVVFSRSAGFGRLLINANNANNANNVHGGQNAAKGSNRSDTLSCFDCHGNSSEFLTRHKDVKSCGDSACHKVALPHTADFKDPEHHKSHRVDAVNVKHECVNCHLDKSKYKAKHGEIGAVATVHSHADTNSIDLKTVKLGDFTKLMPRWNTSSQPFTSPKMESCVKCHSKMAANATKLKSEDQFRSAMGNDVSCIECHKYKDIKNIPAKIASTMKTGQITSCKVCHKSEEYPDVLK